MDNKRRKREIEQLEKKVEDLRRLASPQIPEAELERVRAEINFLKRDFHAHLDAWQRTQLARHPQRPSTLDYIRLLFADFTEIHGDRAFADDPAMVTGMARFHGRPVAVIGQQKGRDTKQKLARNFGMSKPEGYRKALRVMKIAGKFGRPIFTFVDTPGAYPGIDAEERGQAEAIARNLRETARLPVPIIIMWRDASKAEQAAAALKISAPDLLELGLIDEIVPEPDGGAHLNHEATAQLLDPVLERWLKELVRLPTPELLDRRYEKYRRMGQFMQQAAVP